MTAIRIVSYNVQYGFGLDGIVDLDRIVDAVRGADIIAFQEVSRGYAGNNGLDMVAELSSRLADRFFVSHMPADGDHGSELIDGRAVQRRFQFGNMVFSRWPVLSSRGHLLPRTVRRDRLNLQRGALEALIVTPAGPVRIYSVHLDHVDPAERLRQVEALKHIAFGYQEAGGAATGLAEFGFAELPDCPDFLLLGDFNFEPASREYCAMLENGGRLVDVTCADRGWSHMEPSDQTVTKRLDYGFADTALAERILDPFIDREARGSDHMPVWMTLRA